jgi:hypothetical protein
MVMKKMLTTVGGLILMLGIAAPETVHSQTANTGSDTGFFRAPVFVMQPGIVRSFSAGAPTEFNARFVTALPLALERTTLVAIVQWTPFADNEAGGKANSPTFAYGPVVNVVNAKYWSFDVDGLFAYGPAATGNSDYTHKFLVEGDLFLKVGNMVGAKGQWNSLSVYGMFGYVLTALPSGTRDGDRMFLLAGLSLPLAPWKK